MQKPIQYKSRSPVKNGCYTMQSTSESHATVKLWVFDANALFSYS